jgi:hypothetical protein
MHVFVLTVAGLASLASGTFARAGPFVLPREKDETPSTLHCRASKSSRWIFQPWAWRNAARWRNVVE